MIRTVLLPRPLVGEGGGTLEETAYFSIGKEAGATLP